MDSKDKSSRSSSKINLNESSVPLLDDDESTLKGGESKVTIEMDVKGGDDAKPEDKEKEEEADGKTKEDKEGKKKEKKEKKKKEKKEKTHKRTSSFAERLTAGLNLLDRDDRLVNDHVNIVFEDVLAEPESNHGFDGIWRLAFLVFSGTKLWVYRILSAILAIPCGLLWGLVFSILTILNVWVISPVVRFLQVILHILHTILAAVTKAFLDPVFKSIGQLFSNINVTNTRLNAEP